MNKTLSFAKLDYMTIKTYLNWKISLLFLAVCVFVGYGTGDATMTIGLCLMYGVIFACYPFSVGEKNGIDTLYATLPITKKNIVTGRYLFVVCLNLITLVLSLVISAVIMMEAVKQHFLIVCLRLTP